MKKKNVCLLLLMLPLAGLCQRPFICQGNFYLAVAPQNSSSVLEVEIDPSSGVVAFGDLPASSLGFVLNGIGYRPTDNYIYGVNSNNGDLYRIDANGSAKFLGSPQGIPSGFTYPSGDVSPDGRQLILLAVSGGINGSSEALVYIDLESPGHPADVVFLASNNAACYDIAFDPGDNTLYGWDAINQRLVIFDQQEARILTPFAGDTDASIMGSIFFDAFGRLYGYGNTSSGSPQNTLFRIDKTTGEVNTMASGPSAQRSDGCSCPYTIEMEKRVEPQQAVPCTELTYTFEIANASGRKQIDLSFRDVFPEGFTITSVDNLLGGQVTEGGIGAELLVIENIQLPIGISRITVTVEVSPTAYGVYQNQATLEGLPEGLGTVAVSDNPTTIEEGDSTAVTIDSLWVDLGNRDAFICQGEELTVGTFIQGVDYQWSTGSNQPEIKITEGGEYAVTVSSGCESAISSIIVEENNLSVELEESVSLFLGDSLQLQANVFGHPPFTYQWHQDTASLRCAACHSLPIKPLHDGLYRLFVTDAKGCTRMDSVMVRVVKDREIYLPDAFSPNNDGRNDRFFPMSRRPEEINVFRIFSRWGELLFEKENGRTNDARGGWDGDFNGTPLASGAYVYWLEVRFLDGHVVRHTGDINLVR